MRLTTLILSSLLFIATLNAELITWDTKEVELTLDPKEEDVRASFTLTNNSEEPIRIARVKTSCGCTGSILKKEHINPGEKGVIIGTFNKGRREGLNRNKLQVYIEGVEKPVAELIMTVNIPQLLEVQPRILYWKADTAQEPKQIKVTLDPTYLSEFTEIEYDSSLFTVEKKTNPENPNVLEILVAPKTYDSAARQTFTFSASGPDGLSAEGKAHVFVQP